MEALLLIIAMILGMDLAALKSDNPADFHVYDQAKQIALEESTQKGGGIVSDNFGD